MTQHETTVRRVAVVPASGSALFYAEDLLGSSRVIVQSNGTLCYDADFTPFGGEKSYTSTCPQNYKFEGKERDTETGNDDFGARYYTWRFGRWLSSDWSAVPVAVPYANLNNPQTLNLYSMVSDDPESFADLDGHAGGGPGENSARCGNTAPSAEWACVGDGGGGQLVGLQHADREDASLAWDAALATAAQQQSSSKGTGFWQGVSNLFHLHSWNYVKASVTAEVDDSQSHVVGAENPVVTFGTDAAGMAASAFKIPKVGPASAVVNYVNDPSPKSFVTNGLGLIPGLDWPVGITGAYIDFFDYGIHNSHPGPQKVGDPTMPQQLQPGLPAQDGGCEAAGLPSC